MNWPGCFEEIKMSTRIGRRKAEYFAKKIVGMTYEEFERLEMLNVPFGFKELNGRPTALTESSHQNGVLKYTVVCYEGADGVIYKTEVAGAVFQMHR